MQDICMDNMYNEVIMEKMFLSTLTYYYTFGQDDVSFLSFNWAFIFHMTCCIFHIHLSIRNNYITQYVFKSDKSGWMKNTKKGQIVSNYF